MGEQEQPVAFLSVHVEGHGNTSHGLFNFCLIFCEAVATHESRQWRKRFTIPPLPLAGEETIYFLDKIRERDMAISKKVKQLMGGSSWVRRMFESAAQLKVQ